MNGKSFPARPIPEGAVLIPDNATKVFSGEIFDVYQSPQEMYDGSIKTFEMLKRPDTVLVVPVTQEGKVWAIKEEQPGRGVREMRLPGGRMDVPGETALQAAQRECEEEIGVRFNEWYYLESMQPVKKIDWYVHVFVAKDVSGIVPTRHDNGEKIEIFQTTYKKFRLESDEAYKVVAFRSAKTLNELMARAKRV